MKALAKRVVPEIVRRALTDWLRRLRGRESSGFSSYGYEIIETARGQELVHGWQDPLIAERQHNAFAPLLRQMYEGKPREDFIALTSAVRMIGLDDPFIIEIGCGSGWNSEVLGYQLKRSFRYIGLDYSPAMIALGRRRYPDTQFVVGDATRLPFGEAACDILVSGTVLMHLLDYKEAIRESRRVSHRWCIFHTVPVLQYHETTTLRKKAYGGPVLEIIFNEGEFRRLLEKNKLAIRGVLDSIPYNLVAILGEPTITRTYVCEAI